MVVILVGMDVISECDFHYSIAEGKSCIRISTFPFQLGLDSDTEDATREVRYTK